MPIRIVHDQQAVLTVETRSVLQRLGTHPHPEFPYPVPVRDIELVDSRDDPRIQVADIVAGLGSLAGTAALAGQLDDSVADAVRPLSWLILCGAITQAGFDSFVADLAQRWRRDMFARTEW
jgi:hypothetical protein